MSTKAKPISHQIPVTMRTVLLLTAFLSLSFCEKVLKFYKTECMFNPKYVANGTCNLRVKSRSLVTTNIDYTLLIPMENVYMNAVFYKFYNQFRPLHFNESLLFCDVADGHFYGDKGYSYFSKTIIRFCRKFSNMIVCKHKVSDHKNKH